MAGGFFVRPTAESKSQIIATTSSTTQIQIPATHFSNQVWATATGPSPSAGTSSNQHAAITQIPPTQLTALTEIPPAQLTAITQSTPTQVSSQAQASS